MKQSLSPAFHLTTANIPSVVKSALICVFALGGILVLKAAFPTFNWVQTETTLLALTSTWLVNLAKEWMEKK